MYVSVCVYIYEERKRCMCVYRAGREMQGMHVDSRLSVCSCALVERLECLWRRVMCVNVCAKMFAVIEEKYMGCVCVEKGLLCMEGVLG